MAMAAIESRFYSRHRLLLGSIGFYSVYRFYSGYSIYRGFYRLSSALRKMLKLTLP